MTQSKKSKAHSDVGLTNCPHCGKRIVPTPQQLKGWREYNELSQRQMAKLLGVSGAYVAYLESGERSPSRKVIERFWKLVAAK